MEVFMTTASSAVTLGNAPPVQPARQQFRPIVGFAWVGGGFVTLFAYLIVRWATSGHFQPTPAGDVPTYTQVAAWVWQAVQVVLTPVFVYKIVVKPYRKTGDLSVDGVMCIAFLTLWWQDTVCNSLAPFTTNSAAFLNFGSWDNYIPGWSSPNGNLVVEPPLGSSGIMYLWCPLVLAMLGSKVLQVAQNRWRGGYFARLAACVLVLGVVTGIGELIALRLGLWAYQGAHSGVTLFAGEYYQYPLYEGLLFGLVGTAWAAIRHYRNDKGETLAERGLVGIRVSGGRRNVMRVLAMSGLLNLSFLALWQLPMAHLSTSQDAWPESVVKLRHLTNSLCGPGTEYACPSPGIPLNRPSSIHLDPQGKLIVPRGTHLPAEGTTDGVGKPDAEGADK
jgi:hypothetical protein